MPTVNLQVTASLDDAEQNLTVVDGDIVYHRQYNFNFRSGYRFQTVAIPQGAAISSATFSFKFTTDSWDNCTADIYGEDIDDAPAFVEAANNISARDLTTATTAINIVDGGTDWQPINVTAIVQEIINRPGWIPNNDIVLVLRNADAAVFGRIASWDNVSIDPPKLDIDYTTAQGYALVF